MSLSRRLLALLGPALLCPAQAQSSSVQQQAQTLASGYALYLTAQGFRDYCVQNDPGTATRTRQAFTAWAQAQGLTGFEVQLSKLLGAKLQGELRTQLQAQVSGLTATFQKLGTPAQVCGLFPNQLQSDAFDVKGKAPGLGAILAGKPEAGTGANTAAGAAKGTATSGSASTAATGTVYTVAQLSSLAGQTLAAQPKGASARTKEGAVLNKLRSLGARVAVTGKVAPRFDSLEQEDERREVRWDVYCYNTLVDGALDNLRGKTVTVVGTVSDFDDSTNITLRDCQVLSPAAAAGLKKSTLSTADVGWRFKNQPAEKFLVAAGQGLKDSQIQGVYSELSYSTGVGGMMITTYPASLFLKDGTVYNDPYWAPNSFNYKLSRELEPQKWGKWTKQGKNFLIKWGDGSTDTFEVQETLKPAPAGLKLSGTYSSISGGGNTALGGDVVVAVTNAYTFTPQGTFKGGRSASGSTSNVTTLSQSSTSGTYSISGYGITLKYGDGGQKRLFFFVRSPKLVTIGGSDHLMD
ncbi:hypothetical protein [Deinococcus hopiensis]|uniref:Uncharacterized protein n=1 Tax=Deinococcus hopiensis KR-140 TaxID=695939 RepID=A0A1W1UZC2_9DEIO|nr:hypothetical protein [Deinococcus hopiensis]SMB86419.1 hypothetical protein SAMN00790413_03806 [Deinococcus hopiensis KR-140]